MRTDNDEPIPVVEQSKAGARYVIVSCDGSRDSLHFYTIAWTCSTSEMYNVSVIGSLYTLSPFGDDRQQGESSHPIPSADYFRLT